MLWVLLAILVLGGALAIGSDVGGSPDRARMIAGVTWASALLIFIGRGFFSRTNSRALIRSALAWLAIAAAIAVAWAIHSSLS